jgi:hypothetical protein
VTQLHHSTASRAAFTSAWTEFCRTDAGREEYLRRFGDYLFTDREIPRQLLSLPPLRFRRRRQRRPRANVPGGLLTAALAAAKLNCSTKTLNGHVKAGGLKYVTIGRGTKRPRKIFTDADLNQFIADQTRKDSPCPSTRTRVHHTGVMTSGSEVIAFSARRALAVTFDVLETNHYLKSRVFTLIWSMCP